MSVIEKLDSLLAKWRAREKRAEEQTTNSEQDYGNQLWYAGVSEVAGDCANDLDALMPAIRQAMIDAERLREIAELIGCIFAYGDFKAETFNERRLEVLLRENGTFWASAKEYEAARATGEGEGNG